MATVADYKVILDSQIDLGATAGADPDRDLVIDLDSIANLGAARSVLSYMVYPGVAGVTFTFTILSSSTVIAGPTTLPSQTGHLRQEIIDYNVLADPDTLRIEVTAGSAKFSDIVLMHQSDV